MKYDRKHNWSITDNTKKVWLSKTNQRYYSEKKKWISMPETPEWSLTEILKVWQKFINKIWLN